MSEQNKTAVRRLFDELWNKGNLRVADEFIAASGSLLRVLSGNSAHSF